MQFQKGSCPVVFFICCEAAVFVIIHSQPTTDDDMGRDNMLANILKEFTALKKQVSSLSSQVADLSSQVAALSAKKPDIISDSNDEQQRGSYYIRWGRKTCDGNTTILIYKGYAAGARYNEGGGGSNHLCLPEDPDWETYIDGGQSGGTIAGVEYQLGSTNSVFSQINNGGNSLLDYPAPCAVCYVQGRSTNLMIPAKTQCPEGWTTEYRGYLASDHSGSHKRSQFICLDEAPEVAVGGTSQNQALIYPVEVLCGSLPCSVYISGRELTCVVCSK